MKHLANIQAFCFQIIAPICEFITRFGQLLKKVFQMVLEKNENAHNKGHVSVRRCCNCMCT